MVYTVYFNVFHAVVYTLNIKILILFQIIVIFIAVSCKMHFDRQGAPKRSNTFT